MTTSWKKICVVCLTTICSLPMVASAQTPTTAPTGPATAPTAPNLTKLPGDLQVRYREVVDKRRQLSIDMRKERAATYARFRQLLPNMAVLSSPEKRQEIAKDLSQAVRELVQFDIAFTMVGAMGELSRDTTMYGAVFTFRESAMYYTTILQACGDTDGVSTLINYLNFSPEAIKITTDIVTSDEAGQKAKLADLAKRLDAKDPADIAGFDAAMLVLRREMLIDSSAYEPFLEVTKAAATTPVFKMAVTRYEQQIKAKAAQGQVGQPIELKSKLVDGSDFSSASLSGKVIVVDFWATWCGPCKAELPRLKKLFGDYKSKGMAMVSISNDYSKEQLVKYLKDNPDMDWPQLFDADASSNNQWHNLTTKFGINAIPALFVIDRKGILRYVDARKDLEKIIPELLAE